MNIAIIQQSPDIGGAETYMVSLVNEFVDRKNKVFIATNEGKYYNLVSSLPVTVIKLPFILDIMGNLRGFIKTCALTPFAIFFYLNLLRTFKRKKVDVILMSAFTEKLFVSFISKIVGIPVVWIEYGPLEPVFKRNFYIPKIVYRFAKGFPQKIIVPSENTKLSLIKDARVSLAKIEVIPCGVVIPKAGDLKKIKVYGNKFVIGNVSRLTREKGQDYLIRAMGRVSKENPNALLILIGDGPDRDYFQSLIKKLRLENNIKILGYIKDLESYYDSMDVFVFPSSWELEGFGLVVTEAMAHRLPVISVDSGPAPEIVKNKKTGLLVPPNNSAKLAEAVLFLQKNKEVAKEMGEAGYQKTIEKYDIGSISKKFLDVFSSGINT